MKNLHLSLTLLALTLISVSGFSQSRNSIKLYFPSWDKLSGNNCSKTAQVKQNSNYYLKSIATYNGSRLINGKPNYDQIFSDKGEYLFPAMLPMLIVAEVPEGVSNVIWNITGNETMIISGPEGADLVDGQHAVTPVKQGVAKVENPYRIKILGQCEQVYKTSYYGNEPFTKGTFIKKKSDGNSFIVDKEFKIGPNRTYIVVMSTKSGYTHVTAVAKEKQADKEATVIGRIHFIKKDPTVECIGSCPQNSLVISGGPTISPLILSTDKNKISYKIHITNKGNNDIDLSNVFLKVEPIGGWWEGANFRFKQLSGTLRANDYVDIDIDNIMININKVNPGYGVLKAKATIVYPTSPEIGKSADLDLTYTLNIPERMYSLAGLSTNLNFSSSYNYQLTITNTARQSEQSAALFISSVKVNGKPIYTFNNVEISSSSSFKAAISKQGNIVIQYYYKYTEPKTKNTKNTKTYSITISQ